MKLRLLMQWWQRDGGDFVQRYAGDVVEVDDDVAAWMLGNEIAAKDVATVAEPEPEPEPDPEPEDESAPVESEPVKRPRKTAPRHEWDAYARAVGVDPADFSSKEQIIAATS